MSRVVFTAVPAHGHTYPNLPIVAELVRRGEEVVCYSTREFQRQIESTGAEFRAYEDLVAGEPQVRFTFTALEAGNAYVLAALLMDVTQRVTPALIEDIRAFNPDCLIHDAIALWGKIASRALGVPAVCSSATPVSRISLYLRTPSFLPEGSRWFFQDPGAILRFLRGFLRVRKMFGLRFSDIGDVLCNTEDLTLIYSSREFHPRADSFDERYKFIGASIAPVPQEDTFPWEELAGKRVLYISFGTIFNESEEFYRNCFEAFKDWDGVVVMSVGTKIDIGALGDPPANFIVRSFVPQIELLGKADVFISHAGAGGANEALLCGVPMVAIPQGCDQFLLAARLRQLGAAVVLNRHRVPPKRLREAVDHVVATPSYREASAALGRSLVEAGGCTYAADEIIAYKNARSRPK